MHAVGGEHLSDPDVSQVHLACGRIAGVAQAIAEVHRFGQAEGPHERPWTAEYHREAMELNYSPRSIYRKLVKLWGSLGAHNRTEGLHKAAEEGLID